MGTDTATNQEEEQITTNISTSFEHEQVISMPSSTWINPSAKTSDYFGSWGYSFECLKKAFLKATQAFLKANTYLKEIFWLLSNFVFQIS